MDAPPSLPDENAGSLLHWPGFRWPDAWVVGRITPLYALQFA
jgi:hypothetical protein